MRDVEQLIGAARGLVASGGRHLLGVVGPPGSGKSTAARAVVDALGEQACLVPMDGFHLAQSELARLGRAGRKGAPDTFDALGYVSLLRRLQTADEDVVYAPTFDRTLEEPVAGAIAVDRNVPLVVTEGNYLLVENEPWSRIRGLLDQVWYLDLDDAARRHRLVTRHMEHGRSEADASRWVERVDEPNAVLVAAGRHRADAYLTLTAQ
ncbi:MAG: nucleoside/nucleotide kinase family protein [Jiangellaceae bacterium]